MDQELTDLSHLHDAAQRVARLPAAERLRHVRADRWIGYTRAAGGADAGWRRCSSGRPGSGCRTCC